MSMYIIPQVFNTNKVLILQTENIFRRHKINLYDTYIKRSTWIGGAFECEKYCLLPWQKGGIRTFIHIYIAYTSHKDIKTNKTDCDLVLWKENKCALNLKE